jgi:hypothetical protein
MFGMTFGETVLVVLITALILLGTWLSTPSRST